MDPGISGIYRSHLHFWGIFVFSHVSYQFKVESGINLYLVARLKARKGILENNPLFFGVF